MVVMEAGNSVWVAVRTMLWKCAAQNLQKCDDDDKKGIEQVEEHLRQTLHKEMGSDSISIPGWPNGRVSSKLRSRPQCRG